MYAVDDQTTRHGPAQPAALRLMPGDLEQLAARAGEGDNDAFEQIVRTLQGPIRSYARRMMRDTGLGDDAAQDAFFRMWRGLPSYRDHGRFVAWCFTVARNTCLEHLRKEVRTAVPSADLPDAGDDPTDRNVVRHAVEDAVSALEEPYRSTFLMRETGLTYEELAESFGVPLGTVRSRLYHARRILARRLAPLMGGGE